ncbi:hypothetical protein HNP48_005113 [Acidovorax soli]|uniref:Uncharacterized protein n=1 Tax=Acidovorax soli TaxID=592050 RepID=A0A7X0PI77_9BURK|nr:hypothetical protein [Acidovorax soli]
MHCDPGYQIYPDRYRLLTEPVRLSLILGGSLKPPTNA